MVDECKGLLDSEATWEFTNTMNQQYPTFHLNKKLNFEPDNTIKPPIIIHTYRGMGKRGIT